MPFERLPCEPTWVLVLGVDGCKTGWVAAALGGRKHYLPTIDALGSLSSTADALAIDIPIGLPTNGPREADLLAREFLGIRRNSVFLTPSGRLSRRIPMPGPHSGDGLHGLRH